MHRVVLRPALKTYTQELISGDRRNLRPVPATAAPHHPAPTANTSFEESPDFVQSLARGLSVVRAFDREHPALSLSEVAARVGLARAVARRCLLTLQHLGYVGTRGRSFFLLPRVLELGYSYLSSLDLTDLAQRSMEDLSRQIGESCSMAVLDAHDIVYVVRVPVRRVMNMALSVGARLPAFATSMGRVVLADFAEDRLEQWLTGARLRAITPHTKATPSALRDELERVRQQGYAMVAQELELGLLSIAVPVRDTNRHAVAGLNVSMPYADSNRQLAVKRVLPALREAQTSIERAIAKSGWMPFVDAHG
jgi:IclR family transcriptional regulator, pca regulon regulatory protein